MLQKYYLSEKMLNYFFKADKSHKNKGNGFSFEPTIGDKKGKALTTKCGQRIDDNYIKEFPVCLVAERVEEAKQLRKQGIDKFQDKELMQRNDGKTNCLTSVQKDNLVLQLNPSLESGGKQPYQQNRVYDSNGISPALCANKADLLIMLPEATNKGFVEIKPGECFDFENPNSKTIPCTTLERVISNLGWDKIDLLKLDIEGAEWDVIDSTPNSLFEITSKILMEYHSPNGRLNDVIERFNSLGFKHKFEDGSFVDSENGTIFFY